MVNAPEVPELKVEAKQVFHPCFSFSSCFTNAEASHPRSMIIP